MSLRTSLLCVLTARPMTGYELAKQFGASVAHLWHAPHSQIYPELRRLEDDGLVEATAVPRGPRAVKRSYAITDAGRAEVARWVAEVAPVPPPREADLVKVSYLEFVAPDQARAQFAALRDHHRAMHTEYAEHLAELEAGRTSLMQARFEATPADQHEAIVAYKVHVYRGLVARAELQAAWAEEGLALVDRLSGPPGG